ncbi:MAG TPA: DUF3048 domain-containing protein [Actinomycetota bacterium]|nr:DUF3048 domain-containing protein [Actinomycetota bacterium]
MRGRKWCAAAAGALLVLAACSGGDDQPAPDQEAASEATPPPAPECPLSGVEPTNTKVLARPAVAVKIENNPVAYPLSGLEEAEVVYEELVEGGQTRFMAIYHCSDSSKAGPVRSSRQVDPAIMMPITRILAAAGGNDIVRDFLDDAGVVLIDEDSAGEAMQRIPRTGISLEHTLYGDTKLLRKLGAKEYRSPPPEDTFLFGELPAKSRRARTVSVEFSPEVTVDYEWAQGKWLRSDRGAPLTSESGQQIGVDNLIIEEHTVVNSRKIVDVAGNPSIEIIDVTGSGRALVFRDGRVIKAMWTRENPKDRVVYRTKDGDEIALKPGTTWVELVPNQKGELKGQVTFGT